MKLPSKYMSSVIFRKFQEPELISSCFIWQFLGTRRIKIHLPSPCLPSPPCELNCLLELPLFSLFPPQQCICMSVFLHLFQSFFCSVTGLWVDYKHAYLTYAASRQTIYLLYLYFFLLPPTWDNWNNFSSRCMKISILSKYTQNHILQHFILLSSCRCQDLPNK